MNTSFLLSYFKTLSVGPAGVELTTSRTTTRCSTNWATGRDLVYSLLEENTEENTEQMKTMWGWMSCSFLWCLTSIRNWKWKCCSSNGFLRRENSSTVVRFNSPNVWRILGKLLEDPSTKRKRSTYCWPWKQLLITLWYLGNPESIRPVSDRFDITCPTVLRITTRMCEAVVNNITPHFNQWPTGERLQQVVEGFNQHNGLPRCIGAVDGTHIPIKAPRHHEHYINWERAFTRNS